MARAIEPIDIGDSPDLLRLVKEICASDAPRVLRRDNQDMAIIRPLKRARGVRIPAGRPASADDPLWRLVGIGASKGSGDVSVQTHTYLADAYADRHK